MSHTVHDQAISLRVTREMPATPEEVFAAYTEPEAQRLWLTQLGPDEGEVRTAVDLRVGGVWEATFHPNPAVLVHDIFTFVEIDRPHRVVTRCTGESTAEGRVTASPETLIALRLEPSGAGTEGGGERTDHLAERRDRQQPAGAPAGGRRTRGVGPEAVDERAPPEPPHLGEEERGAGPEGETAQEEQPHSKNTRSSSGRRMIWPAHTQQAAVIAMPATTSTWPSGVP